jgi:hypothetical protein
MTGFGFAETPAPWSAWLASEASWSGAQRPARREDLASEDAGRALAAVRAYRGRRLARESLAEDLLPVLARSEANLRIAACEVLSDLRARSSIPALVDLLDAEDEGVRAAAWQALDAIRGTPLPRDVDEASLQLGLR